MKNLIHLFFPKSATKDDEKLFLNILYLKFILKVE